LNALSVVYGRIARARRDWFERRPERRVHLGRPVISVGNLTVGGSGKTPIVAALARLLRSRGERPAILSRGYARARARDGVVVVSDGRRIVASLDESGDEPYMMAAMLEGVPVLVCESRALAGRVAARAFDCTVMLLDDGFQHVELARDVDLLVVSAEDLDDRVLPAGRLREPLETARRADAVLVHGTDADANAVAGRLGVRTAFAVRREYRPLHWLGSSRPCESQCCERIVAVAGIARPRRFFDALADMGWTVAREIAFADHHRYTPRDVERVRAAATEVGATMIVTTEKDAVRLAGVGAAPRPRSSDAGPPWAVLPVTSVIEPAEAFAAWIADRLESARR
jgi:tetraacyldisaccharide 4'-kinase